MFRPLLLHPQEALRKRHLLYCVRTRSIGCGTVTVKPNGVYAASSEDEQVMLETCRGP
jgi:hypothetical protein